MCNTGGPLEIKSCVQYYIHCSVLISVKDFIFEVIVITVRQLSLRIGI